MEGTAARGFSDDNNLLPCKKEELQCGNGLCVLNWLRCHYKKDCGKDYVSIKITCSKVHQKQASPVSEFSHYTEISSDTSMLGSAVLVAGVVIGIVLFLSCVTIIIGSLRKYRCFRHLQLRRDTSYTLDGFYYGGSIGELRTSCTEEFPPAFDFSSHRDSLSQVDVLHPDSPPRYDECVGPGAAQIYIPTDDPPPYSLTDPYQQNDFAIDIPWDGEVSSGTTERAAGYLVGLHDLPQPISSIVLSSSFPMDAVPPYETVVSEQNIPLPLVPLDLDGLKNYTDDCQTLFNRIICREMEIPHRCS
ncbi:protein BEAN1 isoform X2 [Hemicordylus capensis]|uniref:protein BEAN1 isoform X2 n=1 Tax=Hemicordylus capensis TaxID=884348 RepID=UPI002302290F|nr:protein BEAN1 isoform X2 [Hemicordylus capensis]